ncbi:zinc ribbon domain-containing protein [Candidatus Sumerlaeota bacterium]|nr:zinc ribbon domain-containing protein [Candidatus Sumerlaeota bacterium]
MPIYEYECEDCHYIFEELQPFNDKTFMKCPRCGGKAKRLISEGAGLIFKGSGFYITDYARKNASIPGETKKDDSPRESKTDEGKTSKPEEDKKTSKKE